MMPMCRLAVAVAVCTHAIGAPARGQDCEQRFLPGLQTQIAGVATPTSANAMCTFDPDDGGPLPRVLVVAGSISVAGGTTVRNIAQWDGAAWTELGGGLNSIVSTVVEFEGDLIAGGYFSNAGGDPAADRVARWNGTTWSAMGTLPGIQVEDLRVLDGQLHAVCNSSGNSSSTVHRWNGTAWEQIGNAISNAFLLAVMEFQDTLYIGGAYQNADGDATADNIAMYNGTTWQAARLHAGGSFTKSGATLVSRLGVFESGAWAQAGTGLNGAVYALCAADPDGDGVDALYFGGALKKTGVTPLSRIATFNGAAFGALGEGFNNTVPAINVADFDGCGPDAPVLIAGRQFGKSGAAVVSRLGQWNGAAWAPLNGGTNTTVRSLATIGNVIGDAPVNALLAAGDFKTVGELAQKNVGLFACPSVALSLAPGLIAPCSAADIAGAPGTRREHHPDGQVTIDDALAFVRAAVSDDESAGEAATADDVAAFVRAYVEGCP